MIWVALFAVTVGVLSIMFGIVFGIGYQLGRHAAYDEQTTDLARRDRVCPGAFPRVLR